MLIQEEKTLCKHSEIAYRVQSTVEKSHLPWNIERDFPYVTYQIQMQKAM